MSSEDKFSFKVSGRSFSLGIPQEENARDYLLKAEEILRRQVENYEKHPGFLGLQLDSRMTLVAFSIAYELAKTHDLVLSQESADKIRDLIELIDQLSLKQ